ncbi:hypothetical protein L596_026426 [Steinernema carpocapsae]|uniref:Uncharacterized protein n=1 Tax=Steinernema carpocapsae TaxID=34508 RepID=A0A4U5M1D4_STECR|nr:hypothetical protein L596_026426 [Steinernema carpocapsae]
MGCKERNRRYRSSDLKLCAKGEDDQKGLISICAAFTHWEIEASMAPSFYARQNGNVVDVAQTRYVVEPGVCELVICPPGDPRCEAAPDRGVYQYPANELWAVVEHVKNVMNKNEVSTARIIVDGMKPYKPEMEDLLQQTTTLTPTGTPWSHPNWREIETDDEDQNEELDSEEERTRRYFEDSDDTWTDEDVEEDSEKEAQEDEEREDFFKLQWSVKDILERAQDVARNRKILAKLLKDLPKFENDVTEITTDVSLDLKECQTLDECEKKNKLGIGLVIRNKNLEKPFFRCFTLTGEHFRTICTDWVFRRDNKVSVVMHGMEVFGSLVAMQLQGSTKNTPCGTRHEGCVWLRRELSGKDHFDAPEAVGPVGGKFTREHERGGKSWFFNRKQQKPYVIKEFLHLASFACDNLTKMTASLEKTWTTRQLPSQPWHRDTFLLSDSTGGSFLCHPVVRKFMDMRFFKG